MNIYSSGKNINDAYYEQVWNKNIQKWSNLIKEQKGFSREKYEQGTQWALQGKTLDETGELSNDLSFIRGYARGLRLIQIELTENTKKDKIKEKRK